MEKKMILVVEDNPENSILAEKILRHHGYDVFVAEDGFKALDFCKENSPQLIFMDISLPGIDGLEVTKKLREIPEYHDCPIIAFTAHALQGFREKAENAGCSDYMSKPFIPQELVQIVEKHLS